MKDRHDLARGWAAKAESDLGTARLVADSAGPYDTGCFHAQQAVEKLLKALLAYHERPIPKTHDVEELQRLCLDVEGVPELEEQDLVELTDYAVAMRYDFEFWPDQQTAADALDIAERVRKVVLKTLPPGCHP